MSSRVERALENHKKGMNCCQAVVCAFADAVDTDEKLLFMAGEGFGAGMGGNVPVEPYPGQSCWLV